MKYYAVRVGRQTGIFNTWEECKEQVEGFEDAEKRKQQAVKETPKVQRVERQPQRRVEKTNEFQFLIGTV